LQQRGRWLRQSDEAHKEQAAQVGISLDSGPGAARAAFGQRVVPACRMQTRPKPMPAGV
jgi:hypothetical protein